MTTLAINTSRLLQELNTLATFSEVPAPAVTRVLYTEQDMKARAYLKNLFADARLHVREDALGNTYIRWQGSDDTLAAVATGSHIDAIPNAGMYDGTVGVLGGLEAIRALQGAGFTPKRSIELILFTAEEPTRFGVGCLGSRAMTGTYTPETLLLLEDKEGKNPDEARREVGFTGELKDVQLAEGHYHAFIELHIEQGPLLEQKNLPIGVVTSIAAPSTLTITLEGYGGHAGALLMPDRRDALTGAAEIVLAAEEAARSSGSIDSVATVGILDAGPRAVNSVPNKVFMTVDVRDIDLARRDRMIDYIKSTVQTVSEERKLLARVETLNADPPATCSNTIIATIEQSAKDLSLQTLPMVSRAYHDSLFMARLCPVSMIFIPCKNGWSHRPDEYSSPEAITNGVNVLAHTLMKLSS
ncbi:MAG: M20 family metallo-hydrolase [Trueperaceae bacterium]